MALNINGTTGISGVDGSVSAPALTGTDSNTGITFPSADTIKFSTGGVERMSITNSGISGTGISAGGKFSSYAILADVKGNNVSGGTFTAGAWRTRDLNTEIADADGIVSISSNQFTLSGAGSYLIRSSCPAFNTNAHQSRLYNISDSNVEQLGYTSFVNANSGHVVTNSLCSARVTISGSKTFEIQHYGAITSSTYGFGVGGNIGNSMIFTIVEIFKET